MNAGLPTSEHLELATLVALHESAGDQLRKRLGLELHDVDGTHVSIARNDPSIMLNRALGLGLAGPAGKGTIERIRGLYGEAGVERFFLHVHPDAKPDDLREMLTRSGLRTHRRWMKFERGTEPPPEARSDLRVREIDAAHGEDFGRIAAPAFDLSPEAAALFPGLVGRPGFHLYLSFDGDTPAGTGLLYIEGETAWADWGATDPAFRGRGSQRALLARRMRDAIEAGCTRIMSCTGEEVPGDPQHSYHNLEWVGFRPGFLRENWVPA